MNRIFITYIFLFLFGTVQGAHLVGGEINYTYVGNNQYDVVLTIYRDCNSSGAQFDVQAAVSLFSGNGTLIRTYLFQHGPIIRIPNTVNNPCKIAPPTACVEYTSYKKRISLSPSTDGYILTHQRCCRNASISNIPSPNFYGSTYTVEIPGNPHWGNSSPVFSSLPPSTICVNDSFFFDHSVIEPDGDSLHYSLCTPLHGGGRNTNGLPGAINSPAPNPAAAPPYNNIPFNSNYSSNNPMDTKNGLRINPQTGMLSGLPNGLGQFVFAICVEEYRNGILLSKLRRDYQFNVTTCQNNFEASIIPQIQRPETYCNGLTLKLLDKARNAKSYFWDFGDPTTTGDTSYSRSPVYTYKDTGKYRIMLVINPNTPCSDTAYATYHIRYPVNGYFQYSGDLCYDKHSLQFQTVTKLDPSATYHWKFGNQASITDFYSNAPPPITFSSKGPHIVSLEVKTSTCYDIQYDTIRLYEPPVADFSVSDSLGCTPAVFEFFNQSKTDGKHHYVWDFGDGDTSGKTNPIHVYSNPGKYQVSLFVFQTEGCIGDDSKKLSFPITVYPTPRTSLTADKSRAGIKEANFTFTSLPPHGSYSRVLYPGDGSKYTNQMVVNHTYLDTGNFTVTEMVSNQFGCTDTNKIEIRVDPLLQAFLPTAFSPNGDGKNDIFLPTITGTRKYAMYIYDRWGMQVFMTEDPYQGWNGKYNNSGSLLPPGTYTIVVNLIGQNEKVMVRKGILTLIR